MAILVQIMACRLFDTRPLSEPMLPYCQSGTRKHISVKCCCKKFKSFYSRKCTWKCCLWNSSHFVLASMCLKGRVPIDSLAPVTVRSWPSMVHKSIIQCGAIITRSIFTSYPHNRHPIAGGRYGVSVLCFKSDSCSPAVILVQCLISC